MPIYAMPGQGFYRAQPSGLMENGGQGGAAAQFMSIPRQSLRGPGPPNFLAAGMPRNMRPPM